LRKENHILTTLCSVLNGDSHIYQIVFKITYTVYIIKKHGFARFA